MKEQRIFSSDERYKDLDILAGLMGMKVNKHLFPSIIKTEWIRIDKEIQQLIERYFPEQDANPDKP